MLRAFGVAILLLFATPVLAAKVTLPGQVTYREKMALPTPARLRIQLIDESLPTAPPRLDVEAPIDSGQVPLTFTLTFEDAIIIPDHSYALIAAISSNGKLMFRNFQPYAVNPLAPAAPIAIVTSLVSGPAPDASSSAEPATAIPPAILDATWTATRIGDAGVTGVDGPTLALVGNQRAGGSGGCNSWFAVVELSQEAIRFGDIAATKKSCGASKDAREQSYFAALSKAATWSVEGTVLTLYDAEAKPLAMFAR